MPLNNDDFVLPGCPSSLQNHHFSMEESSFLIEESSCFIEESSYFYTIHIHTIHISIQFIFIQFKFLYNSHFYTIHISIQFTVESVREGVRAFKPPRAEPFDIIKSRFCHYETITFSKRSSF